MPKVLSTKLKSEDIDRFAEMAKEQGESKSELLRRLVLDCLYGGSKGDSVASTDTLDPANSSNKGLLLHGEGLHSEYLPPVQHQPQAETQKSTSAVDSGLQKHEDVDRPLNFPPLPMGGQPVYHKAEPGRPATSPKQSSGIGWLIFGGLFVLGQLSESTTAVDRAAVPGRRKPILGVYH